MLKDGVIELAVSEWTGYVVFASEKDGNLGLCVSCRRLGTMAVRDIYPLSRMEEWIDPLKCAVIFSTADCRNGYWLNEISDADRNKTTSLDQFELFVLSQM